MSPADGLHFSTLVTVVLSKRCFKIMGRQLLSVHKIPYVVKIPHGVQGVRTVTVYCHSCIAIGESVVQLQLATTHSLYRCTV